MTKQEFTLLMDEVLNEFDCRLKGLEFNDDGICRVLFNDGFEYDTQMFLAYRFMNRARLRFKIMDYLNLLIDVDPELDLGF